MHVPGLAPAWRLRRGKARPVAAGAGLLAAFVLALLALAASVETAWAGTSDRPAVPVLMYHVVTKAPADAAYPGLYVPRSELVGETAWLGSHGYRAVTLKEVFDAWDGHARLPAKPVVLSFDDGYRSQFVNALPVLRARHWPGVVNLELSHVRVDWGLSPPELQTLIADGWEIDSHTFTHPDLRYVSPSTLEHEVAGSRAALPHRFGVPADFFCYPSGRYDARVVAAVRAAGYRGATTVEFGLTRPTEPFTLDRVGVDAGEGAGGLASQLATLGLH
jgi:peptidoglycan/xylan/chitin deacetylase (PgdA/CDA1 family)